MYIDPFISPLKNNLQVLQNQVSSQNMAANAGEEVMQRETNGAHEQQQQDRWSDLLVTSQHNHTEQQQQQHQQQEQQPIQQATNVELGNQNDHVKDTTGQFYTTRQLTSLGSGSTSFSALETKGHLLVAKSEQQPFATVRPGAGAPAAGMLDEQLMQHPQHSQERRSSNANRSDTAHFNEASGTIMNANEQQLSVGDASSYLVSEEKMNEIQKGSMRYTGGAHLQQKQRKTGEDAERHCTSNNMVQMVPSSLSGGIGKQSDRLGTNQRDIGRGLLRDEEEEEEMIDEIIETDPDEEQPHPVDDHILDSKNEDIGTSASAFASHSLKPIDKSKKIDESKYGYFADDLDEDLINQSVDRINPQQISRTSQNNHGKQSEQQYFQIGSHLSNTQQRPQNTYHSYKSSISSPSLIQLEGGSKQEPDSIVLDSTSNPINNNLRFGNGGNFHQVKVRLSSANKRPSDTQSRGERRLLSANAQKNRNFPQYEIGNGVQQQTKVDQDLKQFESRPGAGRSANLNGGAQSAGNGQVQIHQNQQIVRQDLQHEKIGSGTGPASPYGTTNSTQNSQHHQQQPHMQKQGQQQVGYHNQVSGLSPTNVSTGISGHTVGSQGMMRQSYAHGGHHIQHLPVTASTPHQQVNHQQAATVMMPGSGVGSPGSYHGSNLNNQQQQYQMQQQALHHQYSGRQNQQQQIFVQNQQNMKRANYQQQQNWYHHSASVAAAQQHHMNMKRQYAASYYQRAAWQSSPETKPIQNLSPYFRHQPSPHPQMYQQNHPYYRNMQMHLNHQGSPQQFRPAGHHHSLSFDYQSRRIGSGGEFGQMAPMSYMLHSTLRLPNQQYNQPGSQWGQFQGASTNDAYSSSIPTGLGPRSIHDTNVDLHCRYELQYSHLKISACLVERQKQRVVYNQKLLLLPADSTQKEVQKSERTNEIMVDTESKTEEADISKYIDKHSPIKISNDHDSIVITERDQNSFQNQSNQKKLNQATFEAEMCQLIEKLRQKNEEEIDQIRNKAIAAKKEWRQKRLSQYKKQVQADDDQELNMIMSYTNSNNIRPQDQQYQARQNEINRGQNVQIRYPSSKSGDSTPEPQKFDENQMNNDGNNNMNQMGQPSFPNFYQHHFGHTNRYDQMMYGNQGVRAPNQDLINLENSLLYQQEMERRSKRQQQQLEEQQFRRSMSSMKNQISEVIKEEHNESQISYTGKDSPREDGQSMIKQDNNFDEEVVGEIEKIKDETTVNQAQSQQVAENYHHQGENMRRNDKNSRQHNTGASGQAASGVSASHPSEQQQSKKIEKEKLQQQVASPRSPQIQSLEVDETQFSKIQKMIDGEDTKSEASDKKKSKLNKDLEEIKSKKYLETDEIQDQIQQLLDQKTEEVKQQISKAEKKYNQKMSYQQLFQDSFYSQKQETLVEQVEDESPGIKTEQVLQSQEESVGAELPEENEKDNGQNEKLLEFQEQLEKLQKMTTNLNELYERGNLKDTEIKTEKKIVSQEVKVENSKEIEPEQKDNLESQAQQSQLFDKSTVHTLKEDKNNVRHEGGRSQSQSDHGGNEGIINIKTNKMNFQKSQSLRKVKLNTSNGKTIKIKRSKLKKVGKGSKGGTTGTRGVDGGKSSKYIPGGRRYTANLQRNSNQPKKSHSLDSMHIYATNHSMVSPTYAGSTDFTSGPAAFYAMQRSNYDQSMMNQLYQKQISDMRKPQLQFMQGTEQPKTKWRSNSPKKGDIKLMRRSSYSPVHQPTPIYYELHQQINQGGRKRARDYQVGVSGKATDSQQRRNYRSERKMLKSAHPSLIYIKGPQGSKKVHYQGIGNQTTKNISLKKLKFKKLQSAMDPKNKKQSLHDNRIMIRTIQSPQANLMYNRPQDNMITMAGGAYQRMQGGGGHGALSNFSASANNMQLLAHHHMMRSATSRIDSANSYFANSAISSQQPPSVAAGGGLQKGLIKPIQVYKIPPQIMSSASTQDMQTRSQQQLQQPSIQAVGHNASQNRLSSGIEAQQEIVSGQQMAKPPTVRMMQTSISGQATMVPSKPPRQNRGNDPKNSTFGAPSTSELIQSGHTQNQASENHFTQRHKSAKSSIRPNPLCNPLMPQGGQQQLPSAAPGTQIEYQFTSSRSVFDRMAQGGGAAGQQAYQTTQNLSRPMSLSLHRFDSQQRQQQMPGLVQGITSSPNGTQMAAPTDAQGQYKNMFYRYKNQVVDEKQQQQYYPAPPHLYQPGPAAFQSVGQLVTQSAAPHLQQSHSANVLLSGTAPATSNPMASFAQKQSPYTQKLRLPRSSQSKRQSGVVGAGAPMGQVGIGPHGRGSTDQLLQVATMGPGGRGGPGMALQTQHNNLVMTQRMQQKGMNGLGQVRQQIGYQQPQAMTMRSKQSKQQFSSQPRSSAQGSYLILG